MNFGLGLDQETIPFKSTAVRQRAMKSLPLVGSWYHDHNGAQNDAGGRQVNVWSRPKSSNHTLLNGG